MYSIFLTLALTLTLLSLGANADETMEERTQKENEFRQERVFQAERSVVKIISKIGEDEVSGTGFIIDSKGSVITNYHVVRKADSITIRHFYSGNPLIQKQDVEIIATDPVKDIAVLKIKGFKESKQIGPLKLDETQKVSCKSVSSSTKDDSACKDYIPGLKSIQYLIVANSRLARNHVTLGYIGGIEPTSYFTLRENKLPDEYNYNLFLFESSITAGNSGAPIIDYARGKVIAIATGTSGRKDYLAFGIPIKYAINLIEKNKKKNGTAVNEYTWPGDDPKDQYYNNIKLFSDELKNKTISVNSTISREGGGPLEGAWVALSNGNKSYSSYTSENGFYKLQIPRSIPGSEQPASAPEQPDVCPKQSPWKLAIQHPNYITVNECIQILPSGGALPPYSLEMKSKYKKAVLQFYIDPPMLGLKNSAKNIMIVSKRRTGTTFSKAEVKWVLCETGDACLDYYNIYSKWLEIINPNATKKEKKHEGFTNHIGRNIILDLQETVEKLTLDKYTYADLTFNAENPDDKEKLLKSSVLVYPDNVPALGFYIIQGFLQIKNGGWSGDDGISVNVYLYKNDEIDESPINSPTSVSVDETGYFILKVPVDRLPEKLKNNESQVNARIKLEINSSLLRIANTEKSKKFNKYPYNFNRPETIFIEMTPK